MTKQKSLKRALISSVLALALCFTMLIGTTYAWFTDSVTSANNVIKSGTLNVELYYADGTKTVPAADSADWKSANNATIFTYDKWEPGYTDAKHFKIANEGSLAFNYQFAIVPNGEVSDLADVIDVYLYDGTATQVANRTDLDASKKIGTLRDLINNGIKQGSLTAGSEYTATIVLKMQESAGNEYQNKTIGTDFDIRVLATQMTYEHDSFGNDYDSMAGGYLNVKYSFDNPADLLAFVPAPGASSGLSINSDGEAQIDAPGAWYNIDADLAENQYTVEYDIDITDLAAGENVTVDTGEATNWGSTPIMLERGSTKVYYGNSKNKYLGELTGTVVHVAHTYAYNADNMLEITTIVSDGEASITYSHAFASNPETKLYWDIYYATEAGKATMDNFSVSASEPVVDSGAELSALIAEGGDIVLKNDVKVAETLVIPADAKITLNLNGKTISGATAKGNGAILKNEGTLTLVGGTLENKSINGDAVINNSGTLVLDGVEVNGAPIDDTGYPSYAISTSGKLTVDNGTVIKSDRGCVYLNNGADVVINDADITVSDALGTRVLTTHVIYAYGYDSKLTIKDGEFALDYAAAGNTGASVICPAGATINVYGGNFSYAGTAGQSGIFQNYMGYGAPVNVYGGTYNDKTVEKHIATDHILTDNGDGTWTVELDTATGADLKDQLKDSTATTIYAGENIDLGKSEYQDSGEMMNLTVKDGKTLDLNNNSVIRPASGSGSGVVVPGGATTTVRNGSIVGEGDMTAVDVASGAVATFENVDFVGFGSSFFRVRANSNAKTTVIFKNCNFKNAPVEIAGMNGACELDIQFIECTFSGSYKMYDEEGNLLTDPHGNVHYTSELISAESNYLYGNILIENCKFHLDASESKYTRAAIELFGPSSSYNKTLTVTLRNVEISGEKIVPITIDSRYKAATTIVEEGTNTYKNNGVEVNYDGSAK